MIKLYKLRKKLYFRHCGAGDFGLKLSALKCLFATFSLGQQEAEPDWKFSSLG